MTLPSREDVRADIELLRRNAWDHNEGAPLPFSSQSEWTRNTSNGSDGYDSHVPSKLVCSYSSHSGATALLYHG